MKSEHCSHVIGCDDRHVPRSPPLKTFPPPARSAAAEPPWPRSRLWPGSRSPRPGRASLSLRAVARDMGMTSSALYRYFPSRDGPPDRAGRGTASRPSPTPSKRSRPKWPVVAESGERFIRIVRAYRAWSLEHPSEYALMFGTPVPGLEVHRTGGQSRADPGRERAVPVHDRGSAAGRHPPAGPARARGRPAAGPAARLGRPRRRRATPGRPGRVPVRVDAVARCHLARGCSGTCRRPLLPADDLFEQQMRQVLATSDTTGRVDAASPGRRWPQSHWARRRTRRRPSSGPAGSISAADHRG